MHNIKLISLALLFALLLPCAACADGAVDSTESAALTEAQTTGEPTDEDLLQQFMASQPEADYEGYAFKIVDRNEADHANLWWTRDVWSETVNGEPINDAVYKRNLMLSERYNIEIEEVDVAGPRNTVTTAVLAGEDAYDAVTDGLSELAGMGASGYLIDLHELSGLNLENSWWDRRLIEDFTLLDSIHFATGDISIMDNYGTWCFLFNKKLIDDLNLENPYDLVNSGDWTVAKMYDMAKTASLDLDGDGVMGDWDQYGLFSEHYNIYAFWAGAGRKITSKEDGLPVLTVYDDRSATMVDFILEIHADENTTMSDQHSLEMEFGVNVSFGEGNGLFIFGSLALSTLYRDTDFDFGFLPAPKWDSEQKHYYQTHSPFNLTAYSVPMTASDTERTGIILESMAGISKYTLTPAFYEITLIGKIIRDDESQTMLDIILGSRSYDLGNIFDWGGMRILLTSELYKKATANFSSSYAKKEQKALSDIDAYIEKISE
ncbi:MAG: extracellular solute-binding protein [Eubacteriales bacterium]|nr:extracellular solute-binding protein [Eubacteriales bacterium]